MDAESTVFVVDPDKSSRAAVQKVAAEMELPSEGYESGGEFLGNLDYSRPGCLVASLRIPDIGGLQIQAHLARDGSTLPVIFVSGHADVATAVRAMRAGAVQFLEKPFDERVLWDSIQEAMYFNQDRRRKMREWQALAERFETLTPKERSVLALIAEGKSTKDISTALQLAVRSVELRRSNLMKKLEVESVPDLLRFIENFRNGSQRVNGHSHSVWLDSLDRLHGHFWDASHPVGGGRGRPVGM